MIHACHTDRSLLVSRVNTRQTFLTALLCLPGPAATGTPGAETGWDGGTRS